MRFKEFKIWRSSSSSGQRICIDLDKVTAFTEETGPSIFVTWSDRMGGKSLAISYDDFYQMITENDNSLSRIK